MESSNKQGKQVAIKSASSFEEYMFKILEESKFIDHVMIGDVLDDVTTATIDKLLSEPCSVKIGDYGLVFVSKDGEEIECPNYGLNVSADGKWLSDKIPDLNFDIDQGGNVRKAAEAQSAYCCAIVVLVLKDSYFTNQLRDVLLNYNFDKMSGGETSMSFQDLLSEWQSLQSTTINIAVSAAKFKITDLKKDSERFLKSSIPEEQQVELRDLSNSISSINREYSLGVLSPTNVKKLTKVEILQHLEKRNYQVRELKNKSPVGVLYNLMSLSSEYLDPVVKRKIVVLAELKINELYDNDNNLQFIVGERKTIVDRWKRRYIKLARLSKRKEQIDKYLSDVTNFRFPSKL